MGIREKLVLVRWKFRCLKIRSLKYRRSAIPAKCQKSIIPELLRSLTMVAPKKDL